MWKAEAARQPDEDAALREQIRARYGRGVVTFETYSGVEINVGRGAY